MSKDIRLAYIVDEIYKSLSQMCQMNGADLSEVINELAAKQQLIDIRLAMVNHQNPAINTQNGERHTAAHRSEQFEYMEIGDAK